MDYAMHRHISILTVLNFHLDNKKNDINMNKIPKELSTLLKLSLVIVAMLYLITTFVELTFNPVNWHMASRIIFVVLSVAGIGFITRNLLKE